MFVKRFLFSAQLKTYSLFLTKCYATKIDAIPGIASLGKGRKSGKLGTGVQKVVLPVETDPHKLVNFVCGTNMLKEGGEDVAIKPDSEYPDWLWTLEIGIKAPTLEERDPMTFKYWVKARKLARRQMNKMEATSRIRRY